MWYCNRCKDHKQARKQLTVWTLPHILIVHLKWFIYNKYERRRDSKLVRCPAQLSPRRPLGTWVAVQGGWVTCPALPLLHAPSCPSCGTHTAWTTLMRALFEF
jgi:hypothetical protein